MANVELKPTFTKSNAFNLDFGGIGSVVVLVDPYSDARFVDKSILTRCLLLLPLPKALTYSDKCTYR